MNLCSLCLLLACAVTGFAQSAEFSITGGVSRLKSPDIGTFSDPSTGLDTHYSLTNGWRIGFRTTLNNWRYFGNEFGYGYNRTHLHNDGQNQEFGMAIHQGFYNILAYCIRDESKV